MKGFLLELNGHCHILCPHKTVCASVDEEQASSCQTRRNTFLQDNGNARLSSSRTCVRVQNEKTTSICAQEVSWESAVSLFFNQLALATSYSVAKLRTNFVVRSTRPLFQKIGGPPGMILRLSADVYCWQLQTCFA
jgi:hypothetical protein